MNGTLRFFIETSAQLLVQMEHTLQRMAEGADKAQCVDQVFGAAKAIGNRAAELSASWRRSCWHWNPRWTGYGAASSK